MLLSFEVFLVIAWLVILIEVNVVLVNLVFLKLREEFVFFVVNVHVVIAEDAFR